MWTNYLFHLLSAIFYLFHTLSQARYLFFRLFLTNFFSVHRVGSETRLSIDAGVKETKYHLMMPSEARQQFFEGH